MWSEMSALLGQLPRLRGSQRFFASRDYWRKADRVRVITKLLNKHNTDIVGLRYGERCPDCELRDAASSSLFLAGSKNGKYDSHIRRHKWYGFKLSMACETCGGKGRIIDKKKEDRN